MWKCTGTDERFTKLFTGSVLVWYELNFSLNFLLPEPLQAAAEGSETQGVEEDHDACAHAPPNQEAAGTGTAEAGG